MKRMVFALCAIVGLYAGPASAALIEFDFFGRAGDGLLPGNEVHAVAPGASGGETGGGIVYDTTANVLSIEFSFAGLTGGLAAQLGGGIHIHQAGDPSDPLNSNGGVIFLLNLPGAPNVTLNSPLIAGGATGGVVDAIVSLTAAQEADLLSGLYYVNIHSTVFGAGELRGNLIAVPEPAPLLLLAAGLLAGWLRWRR